MSRTFKDRKEIKARRKKWREPLWTKRFELHHYQGGPNHNEDLDQCPRCHSLTDFMSGFISCPSCGWGNYFPANGLKEEEEDFQYQTAS